MSRANIISSDPLTCSITFQLREGGTRTYFYSSDDFAAIAAGDDPADYDGSETPQATSDISEIGEIGTDIGDIAEAGEIL